MPGADPEWDAPAAVLLAAATDGAHVDVAWIGGDLAVLTRGSRAVAATTPHTTGQLIMRSITPGQEQAPPDLARFEVEAGDTLALLSKASIRDTGARDEDVASLAAALTSPAALADRLAERAFADADGPYAAVAVLRFEG